jgi:tetratricopeptide (TPR) repeat protein
MAQLEKVESDVVWELWKGESRLWRDRGRPSVEAPFMNVTKELLLSTLGAGSYRLVVRASTGRFERAFEWRPGEGEASRVRVLSRDRTPREEASYRRARASSFSRRGDDARAIAELMLAAAALPKDVRLQLELASFRYASGKYDEVVKQLSSARVSFPGEVDVLVLLGASLEALGRIDEAAAIYEEAMALAPDNEKLKESHERVREKVSFRGPRRDR